MTFVRILSSQTFSAGLIFFSTEFVLDTLVFLEFQKMLLFNKCKFILILIRKLFLENGLPFLISCYSKFSMHICFLSKFNHFKIQKGTSKIPASSFFFFLFYFSPSWLCIQNQIVFNQLEFGFGVRRDFHFFLGIPQLAYQKHRGGRKPMIKSYNRLVRKCPL